MSVDVEKELLGQLPPVRHVDEEGRPTWTATELAEHFHVSIGAAERVIRESGLFRPPTGGVHWLC